MCPNPHSAADIVGLYLSAPFTFLTFTGFILPNVPPRPRYGATEAVAFLLFLPFSAWTLYCLLRVTGAA